MTVIETTSWSCPADGCEFTTEGEPGDVKYARRKHQLDHEISSEREREREESVREVTTVGGKTITEMAAEERAGRLEQEVTVRCADCLWEATGGAARVRVLWGEHRRDEHDDPEALAQVQRSLEEKSARRVGAPKVGDGRQSVEENLEKTRAAGGGHGHAARSAPAAGRTCTEVPGCANPTLSDRGRYARVCVEHKDMVTARYTAAAGKKEKPVKAKHSRPTVARARPVPPAPAEPAAPAAIEPAAAGVFAELGKLVDESAALVATAREQLERAEQNHRESVEALRKALAT